MKPDQLYDNLKDLAEKLDITVSEKNFRKSGIRVKSGFCKIKGKQMFIVDKHLKIRDKIEVLASFLAFQPHENLYVVPAVREILQKSTGHRSRAGGISEAKDGISKPH